MAAGRRVVGRAPYQPYHELVPSSLLRIRRLVDGVTLRLASYCAAPLLTFQEYLTKVRAKLRIGTIQLRKRLVWLLR